MRLPDTFCKEMKELLDTEYEDYILSFEKPRHYGLRINTTKLSKEQFEQIVPFQVKEIPFISNGFYYQENDEPAKHPFYYAGLYYLQEPSAMTPAELLPVEQGDCVLDLCAAPGGKATQLAAKLNGTGVLLANDISVSRARGLLKNIELNGVPNCYVTAEAPEKLARQYPECFDKILVDAPCSGEGMFRKEPSLIRSWIERGPAVYHEMQTEILDAAVKMLRPGGLLLYSTCTFSKTEDEETVAYLLQRYPELILKELPHPAGFQNGLPPYGQCIRIYPHRVEGEGHFLALLQKEPAAQESLNGSDSRKEKRSEKRNHSMISKDIMKALDAFMQTIHSPVLHKMLSEQELLFKDENVYLLPAGLKYKSNLRYLRTGLLLGSMDRNGRWEPSQALAMYLNGHEYENCLSLKADDINVIKYLKGETILLQDAFQIHDQKAPVLVCVEDYPLGWGRLNQHMLKNKYAAGWRMQS
ncbi:MAG: RsmB/NOP family class I SAM-dependent RNA methyltransferase [bacterium]|nr:RsmB/NOP family class I SAM-dependent RNA methyltransferase [bacterium]